MGRYYPDDTSLTPLKMFNRPVLEQGTSYASPGRSLTLAHNVVREVLSLVRLGLFQAPGFIRGVSDLLLKCLRNPPIHFLEILESSS
jgi:hypothetical protein